MTVSDAKRKIHAKRFVYIAAFIFLIVGIAATYNGAGHLMRYVWWQSHFDGVYTDTGMWTQAHLRTNLVLGTFFTLTGVLGIIGFIMLFFRGVRAINENATPKVRAMALPFALLGLIPSPGLVIGGLLLLFVYMMYSNTSFDLFGLLLEDVPRGRRRPLMGAEPVAVGGDSRDAYATGYTSQSLYTQDYAATAYGGADFAQSAAAEQAAQPAAPMDISSAPLCTNCGKPTEWIEEYQRYYCYDCDRYV